MHRIVEYVDAEQTVTYIRSPRPVQMLCGVKDTVNLNVYPHCISAVGNIYTTKLSFSHSSSFYACDILNDCK